MFSFIYLYLFIFYELKLREKSFEFKSFFQRRPGQEDAPSWNYINYIYCSSTIFYCTNYIRHLVCIHTNAVLTNQQKVKCCYEQAVSWASINAFLSVCATGATQVGSDRKTHFGSRALMKLILPILDTERKEKCLLLICYKVHMRRFQAWRWSKSHICSPGDWDLCPYL